MSEDGHGRPRGANSEGADAFASDGARPPVAARSPAEIAALLEEAMPVLRVTAQRVAFEVGKVVDMEELEGAGRVALIEAISEFDPALSTFEPFVASRTRWAMLDQVRRDTRARHAAPRAVRRAAVRVAIERAAAADPVEPPAADEAEETLRARLRSAIRARAAAAVAGLAAAGEEPASTRDPEALVAKRRMGDALRVAMARLPEPQRALLERHYFGDERFDEIARSLGVSKSWASRLHVQALASLGALLDRYR